LFLFFAIGGSVLCWTGFEFEMLCQSMLQEEYMQSKAGLSVLQTIPVATLPSA